MNKRIKKKKSKQKLINLAKSAGVEIVSSRKIKRKQLNSVHQSWSDFLERLDNDMNPRKR